MLELGVLGRSVFQMRFQCGNDNYSMVISIYFDKICGSFGYEYAVKSSIDSNKSYILYKLGTFEIESSIINKTELVMREILNQAVDNITNYELPIDLDEKKVKEFYIPLFIKFIKEKREG